jgi:hypothetical protein
MLRRSDRAPCLSKAFGLLLWASLIGLVASHADADTLEISGGGHMTGQIQRRADSVIVRVDDEIQVAIPASRVRRVVASSELAEYRKLAAETGNDAERHYQLALWCVRDERLSGDIQQYKRYHLQRAIDLDPDHAKARGALGYTRQSGRWIRTSDLMTERGMIPRSGGWELPEAAAIEDYEQAVDVDAKKWNREVRRLVSMALRGSAKAGEAIQALSEIRDPLAASAIAQQLQESRADATQNQSMRLLWVKLLGQFRNSTSVEALVRAGLEESDATIREAALNELVEYGSGSAVATYLQYLTGNDNRKVRRAAGALTWFPEEELALTYIDALVTSHKTELAPGPGMQVGFGDGGGGMQMGGKKQVRVEELENPEALILVKSVIPDVDFGYDEQAWRNHIATQRTAFSGDLRRDP